MTVELLTTPEMAEAERIAMAGGVASFDLMQAAGAAVAEAANNLSDEGRVVVVAGPGNNGGDGFIAARVLAEMGREVTMALLGEKSALTGDAARAAQGFRGAVVPFEARMLESAELIVDAIFGAGLNREVSGEAAEAIAAINASGVPVVAVDLPSGVNGTTGAVMGAAVQATETITFFRRKVGHLLLPGRMQCGRVRVAEIGIEADVFARVRVSAYENVPQLWRDAFPVPRLDAHKYARGHVLVMSGTLAHTGAARLAARAALRGGAGLATMASPRDALAVNAAALTAVMVRAIDTPVELAEALTDKRINVCVAGPGMGVGARTRDMVLTALNAGCGVVLDADALTSFAGASEPLFSAIKSRPERPVILTPHTGEFARIFSGLNADGQTLSKLEQTRLAAAQSGAAVVLKGADTVVAVPDGGAAVAANAPPWLATAGSGDVLAGFCAAMLAQTMPAFEAACAAVWLHGECGLEAGPGLIAEDLSEVMPAVHRRLYDAFDIPY